MASLLPSSAARQSTALSLHLNPAAVSFRTYSQPQFSHRPTSSHQPSLPIRSTRTFLTHLRRQAQALKEQPAPAPTPTGPVKPPKTSQPALQLNNLPYFVRRTPSNQLPVYLVTKAGGTKQQTKIQKTEGDMDALRKDLALALGVESPNGPPPKKPEVAINRLNGHILVKGWRKAEILKFLEERNF
ncbi:hypothetical protein N7474_009614 [Penicillium riverlandense]|uniref:uncharacterized protein n=1 Tax=Penicillium riverlandense TaxID=1903569 RepID=UPI002546D9EA|nr:uncharacterized protein N7474_009614 [Penicillium riverlandense]KAJ5808345.1 hypothetical protein N7474_009614 [Penicillium riverlandense]